MVYLEEEQLEILRREAKDQRISLAELIRRALQIYIDGQQAPRHVKPETWLKIVGLGAGDSPDVAEQHDIYLAKVLERDHIG